MRRLLYLGLALSLVACGPPAAAVGPSAPGQPAAHPTVAATASPGPLRLGEQEALLGPGGMTLRQEIGAVMMVGFTGPLTAGVLDDWRQHQFGGLIVVPINHNAPDPTAIRQLIQSVRGVMAHPLLTATNQEGGTVCFRESRVPCLAGARQVGSQGPAAVQSEMSSMSQGLKALGFDINFAPVADVWDGVHPFMSERSYGQNPQAVAQDVTAAIAGIHAAGLYAAAKHESAQPLQAQDWIPLQAAIAARVDFASVPASDLRMLRIELGYPGVIISDDLQMGAPTPEVPPPTAALRFLVNGGDMVIVSHDIAVADATYDAIHAAVLNGTYPRAQLDASVQKLLSLGLRYMP
jgi:beta-N-acetylhexosaminidase